MDRAIHVVRKRFLPPIAIADRIVLDFERRCRRRVLLNTERGRDVMLDLNEVTHIRDGDGLLLTDGSTVLVVAEPEPLLEISADADTLVRIAWHLGNRHLPIQLMRRSLRIRADHVIASMVRGLGGSVRPIAAPFDPERGAYEHAEQTADEFEAP